jgi:hypothetical protein
MQLGNRQAIHVVESVELGHDQFQSTVKLTNSIRVHTLHFFA